MIYKLLITLGVTMVSLYVLFCIFVAAATAGKKSVPDLKYPRLDKFFSISKKLGKIFMILMFFGIVYTMVYNLIWL